MSANQLFLKHNEGKFLSMSVIAMIEQLTDVSTNAAINWNPEARKELREMREAGESLRIKLQKLGFDMRELPPYIDGEEKDYLTKES
jgi:hypothetical protein